MYCNICTLYFLTDSHGPPLNFHLPEKTLMFGILVTFRGLGLSETLMTLNPTLWLKESVVNFKDQSFVKKFLKFTNGESINSISDQSKKLDWQVWRTQHTHTHGALEKRERWGSRCRNVFETLFWPGTNVSIFHSPFSNFQMLTEKNILNCSLNNIGSKLKFSCAICLPLWNSLTVRVSQPRLVFQPSYFSKKLQNNQWNELFLWKTKILLWKFHFKCHLRDYQLLSTLHLLLETF